MGLDCFASRSLDGIRLTDEDIAAFDAADINLCGGMLSGSSGSFRGKVYSGLVSVITGESLYQEWISPDRTRKMYEALLECDPAEFSDSHDHRFGDCESAVQDLRKFFGVCVQRGLGIIGWW